MKSHLAWGWFAVFTIVATVPLTAAACEPGYVWREATPDDHVCVTLQTRSQTWNDNRNQPHETCPQGLVWREATPTDHVCVDPRTRAQTRADNAQQRNDNAAARQRPAPPPRAAAAIPSTATACLQGFVWREATPDDHVCVTPQTRSQTSNDNRNQPNETCPQGLVWREATPTDHICVDPRIRAQTRADNAHAAQRGTQ